MNWLKEISEKTAIDVGSELIVKSVLGFIGFKRRKKERDREEAIAKANRKQQQEILALSSLWIITFSTVACVLPNAMVRYEPYTLAANVVLLAKIDLSQKQEETK